MNEALLFLHLFGLLLGAGPGVAQNVIVRRAASAPPEQAQVLRGLGPVLANVSAVGIAILWITGLILVWSKYGGPGSLPATFWWKMLFVVILTLLAGFIHWTYAEVRRGNAAAAARLAIAGPATGISALLAVLFAVIAFN
jgi:hypothetical protein